MSRKEAHLRGDLGGGFCFKICLVIILLEGWSPGVVVMGDDSCSRGCGFGSQHQILDGLFHIDLLQKLQSLFV